MEAGEILFQDAGSQNVHERPFPNHRNSKKKAQVMMVSIVDKDEDSTA